MSPATQPARKAPLPGSVPRPGQRSGGREGIVHPARSATGRAGGWFARAAWSVERTGRPGMIGLLLLVASGIFLLSTHLRITAEVDGLRREVEAARQRTTSEAGRAPSVAPLASRELPPRGEMPRILRQLFANALEAKVTVDSGKYEVATTSGSGVIRNHVVVPVNAPYARVRTFLEKTLSGMPIVALRDLALERKAIGDGSVDARLRLVVYTSAEAPEPPAGGPKVPPASAPAIASGAEAGAPGAGEAGKPSAPGVPALFAMHSWHVVQVVPVPPPPPPPAPTAPPFPYAFMGSYSPDGAPQVYFLSKGEHVFETHVGDRLDGVYLFESAEGGTLTFLYLPLDVRQTIAAGAPR